MARRRRAKISRDELSQWINTELSQAAGYNGGELQQFQVAALASYYGQPVESKPGRSDAQDQSVADMIESLTAQMIPALSSDSLVSFEPNSQQDIEQAQQETDITNEIVVEENHGYIMFQEAVRDALLLRNGWTRVASIDESEARIERMPNLGDEVTAALLVQLNDIDNLKAEVSKTTDEQVELIITERTQRVQVKAIDPTLMRWTADWDSTQLDGIPFLAEEWYPTRSELIEMGYDRMKVENAPAFSYQNSANAARFRNLTMPGSDGPDKSTQRVQAFWCFYRYDSDGDGIAELHRILYLGDADAVGAILEDEIARFIPYATGTGWLQPHQINGLGVWDKLHQVEQIKTRAWRDWLDNLEVNNFPELAVNVKKVAHDDTAERKPGGIIRVDGEPGMHLLQLPAQANGSEALQALEYADRVRADRAGASLDLGAAQFQIQGSTTAHGTERLMGAKEMIAAMMIRTLAESLIRDTYLLTHRALREWSEGPVSARVRGEFVTTDPRQWQKRKRVNVKSGMSVAERAERRGALEMVIGQIEKLYAAGEEGILVDKLGYYSAINDWALSAGLDTADSYFTNPALPRSQEAAKAKGEQQKQLQEMKMQLAQLAADQERQSTAMQSAIKKYDIDTQRAYDYWYKSLEAAVKMDEPIEADQLQAAGGVRSNDAIRNSESDA